MTDEKIIEVKNLTKRFKNVIAVNNLNLNVYKGDVFGFLGPNGAGKSTTIRMLLSLITPNEGEIKIFDKSIFEKRNFILRKIGAIVEKPDFYGYLSAYKNLEILGKLSQAKISRNKIIELLGLVGLQKRYKDKVKTFSHGMKQRLGLAQALLHDPELIILDEPTTGLDPQGMKEIRDLIIYLSKEKGKTIFLSSHILHEVELVANRMIIIDNGSSQIEGKVEDLLNSNVLTVTIEVNEPQKAKSAIGNTKWNSKLNTVVNENLIFKLSPDEIPYLNKFLVEKDILVKAVVPKRSLEDYFLRITEETRNVKAKA